MQPPDFAVAQSGLRAEYSRPAGSSFVVTRAIKHLYQNIGISPDFFPASARRPLLRLDKIPLRHRHAMLWNHNQSHPQNYLYCLLTAAPRRANYAPFRLSEGVF